MSDAGVFKETGTAPPMPNLAFRVLALWLRLRERVGDQHQVLLDAGLGAGQAVLDYGCGVGSYSVPAAQIVGSGGVVYALDNHPLAIEAVEKRVREANIGNIRTILSGCYTGLDAGTVDVVILFDVLHAVNDQQELLRELHRVLRPDGLVSVKPDHMSDADLLGVMGRERLFSLSGQRGNFLDFRRVAGAAT